MLQFCCQRVRLPGFFPEGRIRIGRILEDPGIHTFVLLCLKPAFCFLDNRLLGKTSDQQLVFRHFAIRRSTPFQQSFRILQDPGELISGILATVVVDDPVEIIWIIIVDQSFQQVILSVLMN